MSTTTPNMPGAPLNNRPLHFFWIVDCSGSMYGDKIATVNHAIKSTIPFMRDEADKNPNAQVLIHTLKFANSASWITADPVKIDDFQWTNLEVVERGMTNMGHAFELLSAQLTMPPMSERALPPVLVLLSDGQPTHEYKEALSKLLNLPWGKKAVRIAISIGQDADDAVLEEFTGNVERVLQANNAETLTQMIKWASTIVGQVSNPGSRPVGSSAESSEDNIVLDMSSLPDAKDIAVADVW